MTKIRTFRFINWRGSYIDYDRDEDEKIGMDDTINGFLKNKKLVDIKIFEPAGQQLLYYTVIYEEAQNGE